MIRVGFVVSAVDRRWMGGLNYLSNLLHAIMSLPDRDIEPVLLVSPRTPMELLAAFPTVETVVTSIVSEGTPLRKARKVLERGLGRDYVMESLVRRLRIDVLSHSDQLGARSPVPTIGWIADFQHIRMPEFFSPEEFAARQAGYRRIADHCSVVLLSSADAQRDLASFAPASLPRSRVLRFVSGVQETSPVTEMAALGATYGLKAPFFYMPNQFWKHKNHRVAIEALALLKARGRDITIVCTGATADRRHPEHFAGLKARIEQADISDNLRILGLVPYPDVKGLFRHSVAIVNPSHFEGWSTTVEEAKAMGKTILLSDIPVHREQAPDRGVFFPADDAEALAEALEAAASGAAIDAQPAAQTARFREFGQTYRAIVMDALGRPDPAGTDRPS